MRFASVVLAGAMVASTVCAQEEPKSYELTEKIDVGSKIYTRIHLKLTGKIVADERKVDMAGQALLEFDEKVLAVGPEGTASKVLRFYPDARAKFVVGKGEDARQLRPNLRYLVGERIDQQISLWAAAGALTNDERELVEDVLDVTRIPALLPRDPVVVGAVWNPDAGTMQSLCDLENFISSTVECKLAKVEQGRAVVQISGSVAGLNMGSEVKIKIAGQMLYNMETNFVEQMVWNQNDSRGTSPVSPSGEFSASFAIKRSPSTSERLSDDAVAQISVEPTEGAKRLVYIDPKNRFRFHHGRDWHVTSLQPDLVIMRRLDGNVFVAQLNVRLMKDLKVGTKISSDQLQEMITSEVGWKIDEIIRADSLPTNGPFEIHYLEARGEQGDLKLYQRHYLTTARTGQQIVFSFLAEPQNEKQLGDEDVSMVSSIEFASQTASEDGSTTR